MYHYKNGTYDFKIRFLILNYGYVDIFVVENDSPLFCG